MSRYFQLGLLTIVVAFLFYTEAFAIPNGDNNATTNSTHAINSNNLNHIQVPPVQIMKDKHGNPLDGRGIKVAVIDSGFDKLHLAGNQIKETWDFTHLASPGEHGTVVTQALLGVAPKVDLYLYKVKTGKDLSDAVKRAIHNKVDIINYSRGGECTEGIVEINSATKAGIVVINAVGNDKRSLDVDPLASSPSIITVGATTIDVQKVARYSNYGINPLTFEIKPDVVAPGTCVFGKIEMDGTSFSAPYVAGAAALMKQMHPEWTVEQIKSALATTAMQIEERSPSAFLSQGSGLINVGKAIMTSTFIHPIHLSVNPESKEAPISITNQSDHQREYTVTWEGEQGVFINLPCSVKVPSKETYELTLKVGNVFLPGRITISSGEERWSVPVISAVVMRTNGGTEFLACSQDGKRIISGYHSELQVWEGSQIISKIEVKDWIGYFRVNSDGTRIAISNSKANKIQVWNALTGQLISEMKVDGGRFGNLVRCLAFSQDGKQIISGSERNGLDNGKVQIWEAQSGQLISTIYLEPEHDVTRVAFSQNGRIIFSSRDPFRQNHYHVWDTSIGESYSTIAVGQGRQGSSIATSADGTRLVASCSYPNGEIKVWDTLTNKLLLKINIGDTKIKSVAISSDGERIFSFSEDMKVQIWDAQTGSLIRVITLGTWAWTVAFSSDGTLFVSTYNGQIHMAKCLD